MNDALRASCFDGGRRGGMGEVPSFGFAVRQLQKRDLLPAIVFVFSRKGCDEAAEEVGLVSLAFT